MNSYDPSHVSKVYLRFGYIKQISHVIGRQTEQLPSSTEKLKLTFTTIKVTGDELNMFIKTNDSRGIPV